MRKIAKKAKMVMALLAAALLLAGCASGDDSSNDPNGLVVTDFWVFQGGKKALEPEDCYSEEEGGGFFNLLRDAETYDVNALKAATARGIGLGSSDRETARKYAGVRCTIYSVGDDGEEQDVWRGVTLDDFVKAGMAKRYSVSYTLVLKDGLPEDNATVQHWMRNRDKSQLAQLRAYYLSIDIEHGEVSNFGVSVVDLGADF